MSDITALKSRLNWYINRLATTTDELAIMTVELDRVRTELAQVQPVGEPATT